MSDVAAFQRRSPGQRICAVSQCQRSTASSAASPWGQAVWVMSAVFGNLRDFSVYSGIEIPPLCGQERERLGSWGKSKSVARGMLGHLLKLWDWSFSVKSNVSFWSRLNNAWIDYAKLTPTKYIYIFKLFDIVLPRPVIALNWWQANLIGKATCSNKKWVAEKKNKTTCYWEEIKCRHGI